MKITRIKAPKFKVGKYSLNEYELRQLCLEVKQCLKPNGIKVIDSDGIESKIDKSGKLHPLPKGMSLSYEITKQLLD